MANVETNGVTLAEAKAHLSELVREAEQGKDFVILRHGKPVAMLVKANAIPGSPQLGTLAGQIQFSEGWDEPMSEEYLIGG